MMAFWKNRPASPDNLRLLMPGDGWKGYSDKPDDDNKVVLPGSRRLIESVFLNGLNATNLILLTGTGASFAAQNPDKASGKETERKLPPAGMDDLWQAVRTRVGDKRFKAACDRFPAAPVGDNIERLLTLCKLYLELNETADDVEAKATKTFVADAEQAILGRVDFVDANTQLDAHALMIQKVGRRGIRKPRARFFTTNYDLCFEEAARRHRFTIIDGFSHALDQVYDRAHFDHDIVRREQGRETPDYIENVFHLYKLHGSIDWRRKGAEIFRSRDPAGDPVLIFPRSSKYQESFEAPYLDMIGAFQSALREPDTAVIVSGFGFNDDHISRPILASVEANMSLRIVICDPLFLAETPLEAGAPAIAESNETDNRFVKAFTRLAQSGDPRIHLINGRFEDMALALPDLVGETDRERHASRIRSLRDDSDGAP
jgi:hypothetical protein